MIESQKGDKYYTRPLSFENQSEIVKRQGHPGKRVFSAFEIDKVLTSKIYFVLLQIAKPN